MDASVKVINLVSWNVRGLGEPHKCNLVRDTLTTCLPSIICLQETKLDSTDQFKAATFLPSQFKSFMCLDANSTRGGILTAWDPATFTLDSFVQRQHTLTTVLSSTYTDF